MKWPGHHVNVIYRCKFSHENTPSDDRVNIAVFHDVKKQYLGWRDYSPIREWKPKWIIQHYILSDDYDDIIYTLLLTPRRGYFREFWVGVCHPFLQILTLFQTKKCHFPHWFSDISIIHTHSQTWSDLACSRLSDSGGETPQFPHVLFSCLRFLNSADPTILEPGTG